MKYDPQLAEQLRLVIFEQTMRQLEAAAVVFIDYGNKAEGEDMNLWYAHHVQVAGLTRALRHQYIPGYTGALAELQKDVGEWIAALERGEKPACPRLRVPGVTGDN